MNNDTEPVAMNRKDRQHQFLIKTHEFSRKTSKKHETV